MSLHIIKRIIGQILMPLPVIFLLALLALGLWFIWGKRRLSVAVSLCGFCLLVAVAFSWPVRQAAYRLESVAVPYTALLAAASPAPAGIMVLGTAVDFPGEPDMPALTRLGDVARARLVEGVRLSRIYPDALFITSGHDYANEGSADAMAEAAIELGVMPGRIRRETRSNDTAHEAQLAREILGDGARVIVVTSASHMARALVFFQREGLNPIPAPCDYISSPSGKSLPLRFKGESITNNEKVWHEVVGLIYQKMLGWNSGGL